MLKVNLEQKLRKENVKLVTARELLIIKEYDKITSIPDSTEVLRRAGLYSNIEEGDKIKQGLADDLRQTADFKKENVFHVDQIKNIANKYRLRFLPSTYYKGDIDTELPKKISQFEIAYNLGYNRNYYILAPQSSFKLQERPKDPLFFYKINESYYYLIHKWGNDLSVFRRLVTIIKSKTSFVVISGLVCGLISFAVSCFLKNDVVIFAVLFVFTWIGTLTFPENGLYENKENNWNSTFKS